MSALSNRKMPITTSQSQQDRQKWPLNRKINREACLESHNTGNTMTDIRSWSKTGTRFDFSARGHVLSMTWPLMCLEQAFLGTKGHLLCIFCGTTDKMATCTVHTALFILEGWAQSSLRHFYWNSTSTLQADSSHSPCNKSKQIIAGNNINSDRAYPTT